MNLEVDSKDEMMHERSVIFIEEIVGWRERATVRGLKRDHVVKIARLSGSKHGRAYFVCGEV